MVKTKKNAPTLRIYMPYKSFQSLERHLNRVDASVWKDDSISCQQEIDAF